MSLVVFGLLAGPGLGHALASGTAGSLDPTFGSGGKALTNLGVQVQPFGAVMQSNGDIVVSGEINFNFGVLRYLPSGNLDATFGTGGSAQAVFSALNGHLVNFAPTQAPTLQPDGKIVVVGEVHTADGQLDEFGVARFTSNGRLDATFGSGGQVATEFFAAPLAGVHEAADAVLVQPDGKLLVGGSARQGQNRFAPTEMATARYNTDGSLDASFGSDGKVLANGIGNVATLGLDAAGNIFAVGGSSVAELSPSGQLAASVTPALITVSSHGGANALAANDQYLFGTTAIINRSDTDAQVRRFTATGSPDPTFTNPAFDYTGVEGSARDGSNAVTFQTNGQVVVGGSHFFGTSVFGLARLNADGSLDTGFGSGGVLTTSFFGDEAVSALLI
jgi:uncharacterized delta-60 repeat protein